MDEPTTDEIRREQMREASRRYRQRHPERVRESERRYQEAHPEQVAAKGRRNAAARQARLRQPGNEQELQRDCERIRAWLAEHPEKRGEYRRRVYANARAAVFDRYGRVCACPGCGATERLTIDHVNGDGRAHRAKVGRDPGKMYRWLIRHGFPEGFQTLCLRCNQSKGTGLRCRLDHGQAVNSGALQTA